jgi:hypothetical protein|nr:MAG TPA: hypothetical protein [Caudoviricetes sp.]
MEIKTNVDFLEDKVFRLEWGKTNALVEAITPYVKEGAKILFINSQKESSTELTLGNKNVSVEVIFMENEEDFINYPNDVLESYDYVIVNPFRFRLTYAMKKLFSTKVPFVMIFHLREVLFESKERLKLLNNNDCGLVYFYKTFTFKNEEKGKSEDKIFPLGITFLCRDLFPEKFLSVTIRKNILSFI